MTSCTLRSQVTRCGTCLRLYLSSLLHLLRTMGRRAMHKVVLQHGPGISARRLHGFGVVLATVKVARVVELIVARSSDTEVLLVVYALRLWQRRIARFLGLEGRLLVLLARPQDGRDGARLLLISAVEVVVLLTHRLLLGEKLVFARVLLAD